MSTTKDLKKLTATWYARLKRAGFHDIELPNGNLEQDYNRSNPKTKAFEATQDYYLRAAQLDNEKVIKHFTEVHGAIWEHHANGESNKEICRRIGKHPDTVAKYIKQVQAKFKLKRGSNV